jgi:hypothetical protein
MIKIVKYIKDGFDLVYKYFCKKTFFISIIYKPHLFTNLNKYK